MKAYFEKLYKWQRNWGSWVSVGLEDLDEKTLEKLWQMYRKTYSIDGLDNQPREIFTKEGLKGEGYRLFWFVDLDSDPDPDAFIVYKPMGSNHKISLLGSDMSAKARMELKRKFLKLLKSRGWYIEGGKRIDALCRAEGIHYLTDIKKIRKLISGKDIELATAEEKTAHSYPDEEGYYKRQLTGIEGVTIIKRIYGNPNV